MSIPLCHPKATFCFSFLAGGFVFSSVPINVIADMSTVKNLLGCMSFQEFS